MKLYILRGIGREQVHDFYKIDLSLDIMFSSCVTVNKLLLPLTFHLFVYTRDNAYFRYFHDNYVN